MGQAEDNGHDDCCSDRPLDRQDPGSLPLPTWPRSTTTTGATAPGSSCLGHRFDRQPSGAEPEAEPSMWQLNLPEASGVSTMSSYGHLVGRRHRNSRFAPSKVPMRNFDGRGRQCRKRLAGRGAHPRHRMRRLEWGRLRVLSPWVEAVAPVAGLGPGAHRFSLEWGRISLPRADWPSPSTSPRPRSHCIHARQVPSGRIAHHCHYAAVDASAVGSWRLPRGSDPVDGRAQGHRRREGRWRIAPTISRP